MNPYFTHDCERCQFLGNYTYAAPMIDGTTEIRVTDLYFHPGSRPLEQSVIARFGNGGPDYWSMARDLFTADRVAYMQSNPSTYSPAGLEAFTRLQGRKG